VKITLISRHLLLLGFAGLLTACSSGTSGGNTATKGTPASIIVTSNLNPSTVGQSVTFTATIPAGTPAITGSVTFMDGTTTLGTGTISGTAATYTASALAAGPHSITAVYGGDSNWNSITSPAITQTVNAAAKGTPASITVVSNLNPSILGQSVTFTATIPAGTPAITGSVTFKDGATTLGTGSISGTTATYTASALAAGSHSITAVYGGDSNWNSITSAAITQTVNAAKGTPASITVASNLNPSTLGQSVTFTATLPSATPAVTGTVTFKEGAATLGTGTISGTTATLTLSTLPVGSHSVTAVYGGDSNWNSVTSATPIVQVVNKGVPASVTVTSTLSPSVTAQPLTFTATLPSATPAITGTVTFKEGATTLGTGTISGTTASYSTSSLAVGTHDITATYEGDANWNTLTSPVFTQIVNVLTPGTWSRAFGGNGGAAEAMAVATDAHNNVIVVGFFTGTITLGADTLVNPASNSTFDIFVVKYSATGAYLWSKRFGDSAASGFQTQRAWAVATDSHDDIFITGDFNTFGAGGNTLAFGGTTAPLTSQKDAVYVAKLSGSNGDGIWAVQGGGSDNSDFGQGLAVDSQDDVLVTGFFRGASIGFASTVLTVHDANNADGSAGTQDIFIEKLRGSSGDALWAQPKAFGSAFNQVATAIALDRGTTNTDGFVLTGTFVNSLNFGPTSATNMNVPTNTSAAFVAKFDKDGGYLWSHPYGGTVTTQSAGSGISVDSSGNIAAIGTFTGNIDFANNCPVTGIGCTVAGIGTSTDTFVLLLRQNGDSAWASSIGSPGQDGQDGVGVAFDSAGNVLVGATVAGDVTFGGATKAGKGATDIFVAKYGPDGAPISGTLVGDGDIQYERGIAVNSLDQAIAVGYFRGQIDFGSGSITPETGGAYGSYVAVVAP
jgi:hypothetical protein